MGRSSRRPPTADTRKRRRRTREELALVVILAGVGVALLTLLGTDTVTPHPHPRARPLALLPTSTPTTEDVPASQAGPGDPPYAVDRLEYDFDEGDRSVHTVVWLPTNAGNGPFPLVVFAHGYAAGPDSYADLLADLAAQGLVVAAPQSAPTAIGVIELPGGEAPQPALPEGDLEGGGGEPSGPTLEYFSNYDAQVADLGLVIGAVLEESQHDGPLKGLVAPDEVGVMGHSDGGIAAAAIAFNTSVHDGRIGAAVILSGAFQGFGGVWFPEGSPPLLAVHGDADAVNPYSSSSGMFGADGNVPKYLVRVVGAGHTDAFLSDRTRPDVVRLTSDFFSAYLRRSRRAAERIEEDASVDDVLVLAASET